ncbi:MAG: hypothetical protein U5K77_00850 [Candidatus Saccharibacteria bacterium]|nr:hypothetical protein [Candidatus Saccharibacteria bacterium]
MKLLVIYRPVSEYARKVDEFVGMFKRLHPQTKIEMVSLDTREGSATASIYDIVQYPALLALRDDGSTLKVWQGEDLPLMDEVASYL